MTMDVSKDGAEDGVGGGRESELGPYLRLMRVWGLWPYGPGGGRAATTAHWLYIRLTMLCLAVISVQQLVQVTAHQDLNNISAAVDMATVTLSSLYRQALFTLYAQDFKRIVAKVDANLVPRNLPNRINFDMKRWMKHSKMYTYVYLTLAAMTTVVWVTSRNVDNIKFAEEIKTEPTETPQSIKRYHAAAKLNASNLTLTYEKRGVSQNKIHVNRRLPLNCWYPFDSGVSPAFEIAFVWETFMSLYSGMVIVTSDAFMFMVIYLICGHLEILKKSLRLLCKENQDSELETTNLASLSELRKRDNAMAQEEIPLDWKVIKCIEYHCDIIELISDLDLRLRSMIVVDFLHAVISLSFAMLQTIISKAFYEWVQMLLFIGICVLHQFLNNLFAEFLIKQQEAVAEAVYGAPWVEGSATLRAAVTMTTAQARSPTRLSGWKMYVLGNRTFVEFMRLLFSYFLVLQSLHAKEKSGSA